MSGKVLLVVEDLFFLSRILETGRRLDVNVEPTDPATLLERLAKEHPRAVILDLNHRSGQALALLASVKKDGATREIQIVGFLSHVQSELAQAAREAGCDRVLARSAFTRQLPQLLSELSASK